MSVSWNAGVEPPLFRTLNGEYPMRYVAIVLVSALLTLPIGYSLGRYSHQNVNDLISVGFRVFDEDGYEVEHFDDGLSISYWTYKDKQ